MLRPRIIPCLLIEQEHLVKTVKFKDPNYLGDPINTLRIFNDKEVDELIFLDIHASKKGLEPNYEFISDLASECFMPVTYGGGIKTVSQIERILKIGIEKVVLNHTALNVPNVVSEAVDRFGGSTIVAGVDIKKNFLGKRQVFSHVLGKMSDKDPWEYIHYLQDLGVGEIFINFVDRDGTFSGYDLKMISEITKAIQIPIVVCGGAGNIGDLSLALEAGASAVSAGSIFVYHGTHKAVLITYPGEEDFKTFAKKESKK